MANTTESTNTQDKNNITKSTNSTKSDDLQKVLKGEVLGNILQDWAKKE